MSTLKFFMDTHDHRSQTFPATISPTDFAQVFGAFDQACADEGVVVLRAHVGFDDGRAFCFTMARDVAQVRSAHQAVGLEFESITEVATATPGDIFLEPAS